MLDKMKQLYQMKKMLDSINSTEDYKGIKVTVNGAMKILSIQISDQARTSSDLEKNILKSINNVMGNVQKKMQKEMKSGDLKMPF
jgi:DNA-binding protein YbaB